MAKLLCTEKEQILCGAEARRRGHADAWQDGATKESVQNLPFTAHVFLCGVGQSVPLFLFFQKRRCRFWRRFALRCMHAPKARTLRSVRSVNRHAPVAAIYDFNFSVPAGTEFCEAAVKWKSVADFYPQGVRGIRKAAKLPTAAQDCRARRQIMLNLFWRDRK